MKKKMITGVLVFYCFYMFCAPVYAKKAKDMTDPEQNPRYKPAEKADVQFYDDVDKAARGFQAIMSDISYLEKIDGKEISCPLESFMLGENTLIIKYSLNGQSKTKVLPLSKTRLTGNILAPSRAEDYWMLWVGVDMELSSFVSKKREVIETLFNVINSLMAAAGNPNVIIEKSTVPSTLLLSTKNKEAIQRQTIKGQKWGFGLVPDGASGRLKVSRVDKGSPAEAAGLLVGDFIIKVNDQPVSDVNEVRNLLQPYRNKLTVISDEMEHEIVIFAEADF